MLRAAKRQMSSANTRSVSFRCPTVISVLAS